ncbi:MAG: DNA repair protein RecN [Proteobacteria bacterium]|nr:DNA repair protein RecN [Pseudomonadota bacterium]
MLLCLRVHNFAIIEELEVSFEPGLNVLTGETGAGKSILVDALKLVLGGRARAEVVRAGASSAEIEALFDIADDPQALERLDEAGCREPGDELVVRRVIQQTGRSRAYLNDRLVPASQLVRLTQGLADISSQHEHHTLVDSGRHLVFLDAFGELTSQSQAMTAAYQRLLESSKRLEQTRSSVRSRMEREDLLRYQVGEIEQVEPQPGETQRLSEERNRCQHAEQLGLLAAGAEEILYSADGAACERLASAAHKLEQAARLDVGLAELAGQLTSLQTQVEEAARDVGHYARSIETQPERLAEVQARLEQLERLERKYGGSLEAVLEHHEQAVEELGQLARASDDLEDLSTEVQAAVAAAGDAARRLSADRKRVAARLAKTVSDELASLGMGHAKILVEVAQPAGKEGELNLLGARLLPTGIDQVEFLIATNRGEVPRAFGTIASGGELSRAMLALKRALAGLGPAGVYVFDEVDAGVGGAVAEVIGRKVKEVSAHHQVICVTHLAQIAAFADAHFSVAKHVRAGRTRSHIRRLAEAEREGELARMIGGLRVTRKTLAAAAEMLRATEQ